jgi:hypothetical protein
MSALLDSCRGFIRNIVGQPAPSDMEVDEPKKTGLFAQCSFIIVRSAKLTDTDAEKVCCVEHAQTRTF